MASAKCLDTIFRQTDSVGDGSIATALVPHVCYLQSLLVCHGDLQSEGSAFTFHWRSGGGFDEAKTKKVGLQSGIEPDYRPNVILKQL
jgi:hypothetical protein